METRPLDLVFYGMAADAAGSARGVLECPWPLTAEGARALLTARFPGLSGLPYHLAQGTRGHAHNSSSICTSPTNVFTVQVDLFAGEL